MYSIKTHYSYSVILLSSIIAGIAACEAKEKVVEKIVYVDREVPAVETPSTTDPSTSSTETTSETTTSTTNTTSTTSSTTSTSTTTLTETPAESTAIVLMGALAITTDDDSSNRSLQLRSTLRAAAEKQYLKCITLDLTNASSCIGEIDDSTHEFSLSCDGFKGKAFGCFILKGAEGSSDDEMTILGVLTSNDLVIGDNATDVEMSINFDPSTGTAQLGDINQKLKNSDGSEIALDQNSIAKEIPTSLKTLDITSGNYEMCMQGINDATSAMKGVYTTFDQNACNGWREIAYIHFNPATDTDPPTLEIWNKQSDYDNCTDATGAITYHISDGTNTLSFNSRNAKFQGSDGLLQKIIDFNWIPNAAKQQYLASQTDAASEGNGTKDALLQIYPANTYPNGVCSGLIDDLVQAYKGATLETLNGFSQCRPDSIKYPKQALTNMFSNGPGLPPHWCIDLKKAKTEVQRSDAVAMMLGDCKAHVETTSNNIWAGQSLVMGFLDALSELRHQRGDSRGEGVKTAYNAFLSAISGISNGIDGLSAGNFDGVTTYDQEAEALAQAWSEVAWEFNKKMALECIAKDITQGASSSNCSPDFSARALFRKLLQEPNPYCLSCQGNQTGQVELETQSCQASNSGPQSMDLSRVNFAGGSVYKTFESNFDFLNNQITWKTSVNTDLAKKQKWGTFIDGLIANNELVGCEKINFSNMKTQMENYVPPPNTPPEQNPVNQNVNMLMSFREQEMNAALASIDTENPDGSSGDALTASAETKTAIATSQLPALAEKMATVAVNFPNRFGWMINEVCRMTNSINALNLQISGVDIDCGAAIPTNLRPLFGHCQGVPSNETCTFSNLMIDVNFDDYKRFAELARRVNEVRARMAFNNDSAYMQKKKDIFANSQCLPDASLGQNPIIEGGELTFEVIVRSPVRRKLSGPVALDLNLSQTAGSSPKFMVESSRLQVNKGGMDGTSCYWGETQRFHKLKVTDSNLIEGVLTEGWVDTCRGGDSSTQNSWHNAVKASLKE